MIELRKVINSKLKTIHPRAYFEKAQDNTLFPYLIFNFPSNFTSEEQEIFNLDVDVWDAPLNGDTTQIETLASAVWKDLHKFEYMDSNIQFSVYRENRMPLDDDDPRIRRRKLIFQLRYFDRRLYE